MTPDSDRPDQARDLRERIAALETELLAVRAQAAAERRRLQRDRDRAERVARERERALGIALADAQRLRSHPAVKAARTGILFVKRPIKKVRRSMGRVARPMRFVRNRLRAMLAAASRQASIADERRFVEAMVRRIGVAPTLVPGRVSVVVASHGGAGVLRRCLAGLNGLTWADLEIIVAAPGADALVRIATGGDDRPRDGQTRVRPAAGVDLADARREAVAIATGDWILFLDDDMVPLEPGALARMIATATTHGAGAVGALLVHPRGTGGSRRDGPRELRLAHRGIHFVNASGMPIPAVVGRGENPLDAAVDITSWPAASEACLLIAGPLALECLRGNEDQHLEPVDMCLRIQRSGRSVLVDGSAVFWDHDTRHDAGPRVGPAHAHALDGPAALHEAWGPALFRTVMLDRLSGSRTWSQQPLHVGLTLTSDDPKSGFGDWYTAHELGDALVGIGWRVSYLARQGDRWYEPDPSIDVIVSLLPQLDLRRLPRHAVTVAWIRNWTDAWIDLPCFQDYDLVLVSSETSRALVEEKTAKLAHVFPIATNPDRFRRPESPQPATVDAVFVGSSWGVPRGIEAALPDLVEGRLQVRVHGRGWENHPVLGGMASGLLDYDDIPRVYAESTLVLDDAAVGTKPYGSVNSRVFDALAAGALVVTDNEVGVRELFDADFPVWSDGPSLHATVRSLLDDPLRRVELADRYRGMVLARHTYAHRALELRRLLIEWTTQPKVAAHIGPQTWAMGSTWGDVPFGRDVQRNLERLGRPTAVLVHDERVSGAALRADIALHIFGVRAPRPLSGQVNALWVISHPDRVTPDLCETYDAVFVASDPFLATLRERTDVPLHPLHQATEPTRFHPDPTGPNHELLFVGNSRGVRRPIIDDLRTTTRDLAVYGGMWTPDLLDPRFLRGTWIPNDTLRTYYSSAAIVLNDHWGDMREGGFISNRVYDALACGAFVISDHVVGIEEEFDGAVATYTDPASLDALIETYLNDPEARRARAARGRASVLARHTFGHRVRALIEALEPIVAQHPAAVVGIEQSDVTPGASDPKDAAIGPSP